ncbi:hypothetical protein ACH9D2_18945 [Kocuria sp. M4R2S49]|uniref:hypothetical protein n=1 Tax=Kocuria rhizosphaericola TaxID=3376284 RepID=UPI0037BA2471
MTALAPLAFTQYPLPVGDSPLNTTVKTAIQQAFLTEEEPSRLPEEWLRGRSGRAGEAYTYRLLEHPDAADALTALAFYLCYALPDPARTEGRFWMPTAPFQRVDDGSVALARLTVQDVETLVVFHDPSVGTIVKTNLVPYPVLPADYGSVVTEHYTSNGPMQTVDPCADGTASALYHDPVFRTAARRAAVGRMRKGPTAQRRHHDWAPADAVYAHIDEFLEITR